MKICVSSKLSIPALGQSIPTWKYLSGLKGFQLFRSDKDLPIFKPDVVIGMGVSVMNHTAYLLDYYPSARFFAYVWDCYRWGWERPRKGEYDYRRYYSDILPRAEKIFVPSYCTGHQLTSCWDLKNWQVIRSSVPYWDYPKHEICDGGYALCALREIPDIAWPLFQSTCRALGIPYVQTMHDLAFSEYQDKVAKCSFIVSHMDEMSTGGLSAIEAYHIGKPVLMSNSPWHGGVDYFGDRATYFDRNDPESFGRELKRMLCHPPEVPADHAAWVKENFSSTRMEKEILAAII